MSMGASKDRLHSENSDMKWKQLTSVFSFTSLTLGSRIVLLRGENEACERYRPAEHVETQIYMLGGVMIQ